MLNRNTYPSRVLRLRRSQRHAAWHEPIYNICRLFLQKLVENELSQLIDNLDFRSKNYHFILIHWTLVFPGSDITLRASFRKICSTSHLKVGPVSGRHLGLKKRPKTAGDRFPEEF